MDEQNGYCYWGRGSGYGQHLPGPSGSLAAVIAPEAGSQVEQPKEGAEAAASAPKKGDGGVETAEEAVEPAQPDINELCTDMFEKMAIFLQGELTATCEDYRLLENMNKLTSLKYMEMKDISINISRNLQDLNNKYASLQPYLDQIMRSRSTLLHLNRLRTNWMPILRNWRLDSRNWRSDDNWRFLVTFPNLLPCLLVSLVEMGAAGGCELRLKQQTV
ncbi:hypothetical protein WMY93_024197 [Mugilogobius chulae]|uniref:Biogenesis of lysosome-related organelles complex 1 subunit 2 n=1 Tax=Mugilogobius chulae TaxID=88201 RepID=A0AAW0N916_9GOBI